MLVDDINPGSGGSSIGPPTVLGSAVFFSATDGSAHGQELWTSDGTTAGTMLVEDINPGSASSSPASLTVLGTTLMFSADDGVNGAELWAA